MATTSRFGLHYLTSNDAPDIAGVTQNLATDTDGWLSRFYPVANAAARIALTGISAGFTAIQADDNSTWVWTGSAWIQLNVSTSGGAGGTSPALTYGQWSATATQTFTTTATDYPVAFAVQDVAATGVTQSTKGVGHKWSVPAGYWLASATVRFAAGTAGSRFLGLRTDDDVKQFASAQNDGGPAAATRALTTPLVLAATTSIYVVASQSSGGSLATQTTGTQSPSGYVQFSLTRLA